MVPSNCNKTVICFVSDSSIMFFFMYFFFSELFADDNFASHQISEIGKFPKLILYPFIELYLLHEQILGVELEFTTVSDCVLT